MELRGALAKQHLVESKNAQLQQMRENEARRESEREMDMMWCHLVNMEDMAKVKLSIVRIVVICYRFFFQRERDEQDAFDRFNREKVAKDVLDLQVKGKVNIKPQHLYSY